MSYRMEIDLHGETVDSGRQKLQNILKTLPKYTRELVVIHGYHRGNALQNMVRNFKHCNVERKILGLNQGETIFLIKNNKF